MSEEAPNPADLRANLAEAPTGLATYRTALALDRTTLGMASFGFGMVAFFRAIEGRSPGVESLRWHQGAIRKGAALILLGIVATVYAGVSHWSSLRRPRRAETPVLGPWPPSLTVTVLSAVIGLAGLWEFSMR